MATPPYEYLRHAPGLGAALLVALTKLREGWRVTITQFVMGAIPVLALGSTIEWASRKFEIPSELLGFAVGGLGVAVVSKALQTVLDLNVAGWLNSFLDRWAGVKAHDVQRPNGEQQP